MVKKGEGEGIRLSDYILALLVASGFYIAAILEYFGKGKCSFCLKNRRWKKFVLDSEEGWVSLCGECIKHAG